MFLHHSGEVNCIGFSFISFMFHAHNLPYELHACMIGTGYSNVYKTHKFSILKTRDLAAETRYFPSCNLLSSHSTARNLY